MMAHIAAPGLDMLSRNSARLDLIGRLKPGCDILVRAKDTTMRFTLGVGLRNRLAQDSNPLSYGLPRQ
jgi:hypothetical protein